MSGLLGFLKSGKVEEVAVPSRTGTGGGPRKERNPKAALLALRLFYNGAVFPSQALVEKFSLEYRKSKITKETLPLKDGQKEAIVRNKYEFPEGTGNGLDVIDTKEWNQYKGDGRLLFVAIVPKDQPKVDLFGSVAYEDNGTPKISVMEQGAATFGGDVMVPMVEEVYGIKLGKDAEKGEKEFIDLEVIEVVKEGDEEFNVTKEFSKDIMFVPKRVSRGKDKGKMDYERRENCKVYLLDIITESTTIQNPIESDETVDLTDATPVERAAFLEA